MQLAPAHRLAIAALLLAIGATACGPSTTSQASASPGPTGGPTGGPTLPVDPLADPPRAMLAVEGGDPVAGALGSYDWGDVGSGGPWLPGTPITVGAGEVATVFVDQRLPIVSWRARAAAAPDFIVASGLSNGGPPVRFGVPGPGEWSIEVTIQFPEGVGSATYYWRMTVE